MEVLVRRGRQSFPQVGIGHQVFLLRGKATSDLRVFLWHSLLEPKQPLFGPDWLQRDSVNWQDLKCDGVVPVEQPKVCVVPDYLVSVVEVGSVVTGPVL